MSRTSVIKQEILKILGDGKEHSVNEIKEKIRRESDANISEGVFSGSFRTLVIEKKCENPERGIYVINKEHSGDKQSKKVFEPDVKNNEKNLALKQAIIEAARKFEGEVNLAMKGIDISVADSEVLEYCLEMKKILGELKEKLNDANQILR